jgi:hypothetical protein
VAEVGAPPGYVVVLYLSRPGPALGLFLALGIVCSSVCLSVNTSHSSPVRQPAIKSVIQVVQSIHCIGSPTPSWADFKSVAWGLGELEYCME